MERKEFFKKIFTTTPVVLGVALFPTLCTKSGFKKFLEKWNKPDRINIPDRPPTLITKMSTESFSEGEPFVGCFWFNKKAFFAKAKQDPEFFKQKMDAMFTSMSFLLVEEAK